jgi:hypothetical protein
MSTFNNSVDAKNTVQYDLSGLQDPTVVATRGAPGSTFRKLSNPPRFYLKLDDGETTNWLDLYASGLVYGQNVGTGAQVLKNVVSNTLTFRTLKNTDQQLVITQGSNEITINANTNELRYPIILTTTTNDFETFWAYQMPLNSCEKIAVKVVGQKLDGTHRNLFERVGLFFNNSGTVQSQRVWQVTSSFRTNENIKIRYEISGDVVQIQVKSLNSDPYRWKGEIVHLPLVV